METDLQSLSSSARWRERDPQRHERGLLPWLKRLIGGQNKAPSFTQSIRSRTAEPEMGGYGALAGGSLAMGQDFHDTHASPFVSPITGRPDRS